MSTDTLNVEKCKLKPPDMFTLLFTGEEGRLPAIMYEANIPMSPLSGFNYAFTIEVDGIILYVYKGKYYLNKRFMRRVFQSDIGLFAVYPYRGNLWVAYAPFIHCYQLKHICMETIESKLRT